MVLRLRGLTAEERSAVDRLAHARRTAPARRVERARITWQASRGAGAPEIAATSGLDASTVRGWIRRFNAEGLAGLDDRPRAGRPPTYTPEQRATVIAIAPADPKALGPPSASWTLDRLAAYPSEHAAIAIKRSRIDELLRAEGPRRRKQESWCGARVDPAFAEKRGGSRRPAELRPQAA